MSGTIPVKSVVLPRHAHYFFYYCEPHVVFILHMCNKMLYHTLKFHELYYNKLANSFLFSIWHCFSTTCVILIAYVDCQHF